MESIKLSVNAIDSHVAITTNKYKDLNSYSKNAKIAKVRPIFKEDERTKNLNVFSKIFEKFTHYSLIPFVFFFSEFISAYQKLVAQTCINKNNRNLKEIFRSNEVCQSSHYGYLYNVLLYCS